MNLPRKNIENRPYLSWSQISCYLTNKSEYKKRYIDNEPFLGNEYTEFGSKVGRAFETGDFSEFSDVETEYLIKCERLDKFEEYVCLQYDEFDVIGYIDTCTEDKKRLIDYKTGSKKSVSKYKKPDYLQLCYYALAIKQECGYLPQQAQVQYIFRSGNAFIGQELKVAQIDPVLIDIDISLDRLKNVYWRTIEVAKSIEKFYLQHKHETD